MSGETKIGESDVEFVIKHDVLRLEVTMGNTLSVHKMHHLEHLLEVVAASWLIKWLKSNIVKELTTSDELKSNIGYWNFSSVGLNPLRILFEFIKANHVGVITRFVDIDLVFECLHGFGGILRIRLVKDLESYTLTVRILSKFHLG